MKKFGVTAVAPNLESNADSALTRLFRGLQGGGTHVAVVTNNMLCARDFQSTVKEKTGSDGEPVATMLIADEAHTLGADAFIANKPEFFARRLALSATPERQYDPDGTERYSRSLVPTVYEFGLDQAIGFCLVPYNYHVHACTLEGDELRRVRPPVGTDRRSDGRWLSKRRSGPAVAADRASAYHRNRGEQDRSAPLRAGATGPTGHQACTDLCLSQGPKTV